MAAVELSRRELLALALGTSATQLGWFDHLGTGRRQYPGELLAQNVTRAHRLRSPLLWPTEPIPTHQAKVIVVGGGISGLAAAWRLAPHKPVVFELDDVPFGTSGFGTAATTLFPLGAHYINAPTAEQRTMRRLLNEAGLTNGDSPRETTKVAEQHLVHDPEERLFYRGRWYEGRYLRTGATADDLQQLERFNNEVIRCSQWRDARGRKVFALPSAGVSDDASSVELDRQTAAAWLDARGFSSTRLRWLVDYACRDDYGSTLEQTSAWAALLYFAARVDPESHGGKDQGESLPLATWPEGNARIAQALQRPLENRYHLRSAVRALRQNNAGVELLVERYSANQAEPVGLEMWRADYVVLAVPQFVARRLLQEPAEAEFVYTPWFTANLHVSRLPSGRGFPLCWDNVIYDSPALGYVVATHQHTGHEAQSVLTYYYPYCRSEARAALLAADHHALADIALTDLCRAHPELPELTTRIDIARFGHAMVQPRPGFFFGSARRNARQPRGRVHLAHTDLSGLALCEEALDQGVRAAEEIAAKLERAPGPSWR